MPFRPVGHSPHELVLYHLSLFVPMSREFNYSLDAILFSAWTPHESGFGSPYDGTWFDAEQALPTGDVLGRGGG